MEILLAALMLCVTEPDECYVDRVDGVEYVVVCNLAPRAEPSYMAPVLVPYRGRDYYLVIASRCAEA
jgi:hypothetical protein